MTNYISPAARRGSEATINEPTSRRATSFDQRGIALQTVIIMVVLLAIAGGIAAVLLSRGQQTSAQLEGQAIGTPPSSYTSESFCNGAGHHWDINETPKCGFLNFNTCISAGGVPGADDGGTDDAAATVCMLGSTSTAQRIEV